MSTRRARAKEGASPEIPKALRCRRHPGYKAQRPPRSKCVVCADLYFLRHPPAGADKVDRTPLEAITFERLDHVVRRIEGKRNYFLSSCLNNTAVDPDFWKAVMHFRRHRSAEVLIGPTRYKNPKIRREWLAQESAQWRGRYWWAPEVRQFLVQNELELHRKLRVMFHVSIQATTPNPLSGIDALSQGASAIYAHAQLQSRTGGTMPGKLPTILVTTGAVNEVRYWEAALARRAEFHHVIGGVIVETRGDRFYLRDVLWDRTTKTFVDADEEFSARGVRKAGPALALICGDEHRVWASPDFVQATYFGRDSMVRVLRPQLVVHHDFGDGYATNPHHLRGVLARTMKACSDLGDVELELERDAMHFQAISHVLPKGARQVVVASNHHDFLRRWVDQERRPGDRNDLFWLRANIALRESAELGIRDGRAGLHHHDPYAYWVGKKCAERGVQVQFLTRTAPFAVGPKGVELPLHGDMGPNGARGSRTSFAKLGPRTVVAHTHAPGREKGCTQVGTGALPQEYEQGPGSHMAANAILQSNGQVQLVFIPGPRWRDW